MALKIHSIVEISPCRPWTPEEDAIVTAEYKTTPAKRLAWKLGRTRYAVIGRAKTLGCQRYKRDGVHGKKIQP